MEDDIIGDKELLVAKSDKKYRKIYIDSCNICQKIKNRTKALVEKLKLSEVPERV